MGLVVAQKNEMLDAVTPDWDFASLHSGSTGGTGANELSGGSPAYARKSITWGAAAGGAVANTNQIVFDVPAGSDVEYVGLWSLASAGTFFGDFAASSPADEVGAVATVDTADLFTAPGHTFDDGDQVVVVDTGNSTLPTGVSENTTYFVRDVVASTSFKLAATSGGAAIDITAAGACFVFSQTVEVFAGQGTYTIEIGDLVVDLLALT